MKKFYKYFFALCILCIKGCAGNDNPIPGVDEWKGREVNTNPSVLVQECNNLYIQPYQQSGDVLIEITEDDSEVDANIFTIKLNVVGNSTSSDYTIDKQLLEQHYSIPWGYYLEYRLEEVLSIKISSDQQLFGRNPGSDLSDKFVFNGCVSGILPWITKNKEFKGLIPNGTQINDYLISDPLLFAEAFFKLSNKPKEASNTPKCKFFISIELKNGKVLNANTAPITLK